MHLLVVSLPLISSLVAGFFGRFLGKTGVIFVAIPSLFLAWIVAIVSFFKVGIQHEVAVIELGRWIESGLFYVKWGFLFDSLTATMLVVVTTISLLVHIYSVDYMGQDPHFIRFMSYLSLFTFFMLVLVTADNLLQLFLGWEGVGLSSYLLINFWFTRIQANKAAIKAMLMNRIGDFFLGMGVAFSFYVFKSVDFGVMFSLVPVMASSDMGFLFFEVDKLTIIGVCLFLAAVGKSAQLGLHTWLPDAMEGPTPVSALIHAATMVTAGVFLLIRSSPLLEYTFGLLTFILILAAITALFASTVGVFQNDIKRVIAFSTTSQLGYMVLACSLSAYSVAMFHLVNHAFFKALLFLGSGAVIHAMSDEQDMRKMGGLVNLLPFVYVCMLIGSLALAGTPFLSGFYSKDAILELSFANFDAIFGYWFGTIAAFFTAYYSMRLLYFTFFTSPNGYRPNFFMVQEVSWIMLVVLITLIFGSIFIGYLGRDLFIGLGSDFWGNSIVVLPQSVFLLEAEFLDVFIKLIPIFFSFCGLILSYFIYSTNFISRIAGVYRLLYIFFSRRWFFDTLYIESIARPLLKFGYVVTFRFLDRGLIEWLGPYGLVKVVDYLSTLVSRLGSGYIYHYFLLFFFGFLGIWFIQFGVFFVMLSFLLFFFFSMEENEAIVNDE